MFNNLKTMRNETMLNKDMHTLQNVYNKAQMRIVFRILLDVRCKIIKKMCTSFHLEFS